MNDLRKPVNPTIKGVEISISHIEDVEHVTFNRIAYKRVGSTTSLIQVHDRSDDSYKLISEREFAGAKEQVEDPEGYAARTLVRRGSSSRSRRMFPATLALAAVFAGMHAPSNYGRRGR